MREQERRHDDTRLGPARVDDHGRRVGNLNDRPAAQALAGLSRIGRRIVSRKRLLGGGIGYSIRPASIAATCAASESSPRAPLVRVTNQRTRDDRSNHQKDSSTAGDCKHCITIPDNILLSMIERGNAEILPGSASI